MANTTIEKDKESEHQDWFQELGLGEPVEFDWASKGSTCCYETGEGKELFPENQP